MKANLKVTQSIVGVGQWAKRREAQFHFAEKHEFFVVSKSD
jgi:hypothetical protein